MRNEGQSEEVLASTLHATLQEPLLLRVEGIDEPLRTLKLVEFIVLFLSFPIDSKHILSIRLYKLFQAKTPGPPKIIPRFAPVKALCLLS